MTASASGPTPGGWPETEEALSAWYADYEDWARSRSQEFDLEALRERLWGVAAAGRTIAAGEIMAEFHLARGSRLRAVGYVVELVSERNRLLLNHPDVYLSTVVVTESSKSSRYPDGVPLDGYFYPDPPSHEAIGEALDDRKRTQQYCAEHPFARHS